MQAVAVFGGGRGGGGGGGGSMSTVSREENLVMSSEDSSSPDEGGELELGLGLSLGGRDGGFKGQQGVKVGRYARILTAKDLPSVVSAASSSSSSSSSTSSSSSSSVLSRANNNAATSGTKRSADSFAASNGASSQVVGWPPIRAYRMNSMVNQVKSLATEEFNSMNQKNIGKNKVLEKADYAINGNAKTRTSLFVKVNMDGIPIGRKVDLKAHGGYEALSRALEDMFLRPSATVNGAPEHNMMIDAARRPRLLDGSSEFVLTYEDKEGDWMLVGDVPWGMFLGSVRRLRIMRTSEATGLGK